jgi:iron-sulfur cluster assembly protein
MGRLEGASEERSEPMLVLTGEAVEVIRGIVEMEDGAGGRSGLRITTEELSAEEAELNMTVAEAPEDGDETVEQDGVCVYLSGPAAQLLDDKELDAHEHDDHVHFTVAVQGEEHEPHEH